MAQYAWIPRNGANHDDFNWIQQKQNWFGSGQRPDLKKMADLDLNLYIGADAYKAGQCRSWPWGVSRQVTLSMHHHINTVVRSCFFHLRRLKLVRRILGAEVTSGLVYTPSWQPGLTTVTQFSLAFHRWRFIDPLQRVQNAAARLHLREQERGTIFHSSPPEPTLGFRFGSLLVIIYKTLRAHAHGASLVAKPCVPVHDDIRRWPAWIVGDCRSSSSFRYDTSTVETKVRRAEFLVFPDRRHGMLFRLISSELFWHWYFQKTFENSPFYARIRRSLIWLCWCTIGHCRNVIGVLKWRYVM